MTAAAEVWRPIPGWDGWYSIDPYGRVRSEARTVTRRDGVRVTVAQRLRKVRQHPTGRRTVRLRREGQQFTARVDRLVAELFPASNRVSAV